MRATAKRLLKSESNTTFGDNNIYRVVHKVSMNSLSLSPSLSLSLSLSLSACVLLSLLIDKSINQPQKFKSLAIVSTCEQIQCTHIHIHSKRFIQRFRQYENRQNVLVYTFIGKVQTPTCRQQLLTIYTLNWLSSYNVNRWRD